MSIITYLYGISIWISEILDAAFGRVDSDMQQYPLGRKRLRITGINVQHAVSHMENMHQFFMQGMHCDIDIIVGKKRYPVHRTILLTASEYFRKRLDKNTNELVLKKCEGVRDETVEQTIQFLYLGKMELMMHQVANIIKFSEILQLPELKKFCISYMEKCVPKTNPSLPVIKRIHDFMLDNFTKVMAHEHFLNLSFNKVKALLQSDDLIISSEEEAFKGLTLWLRKDWNNRKQHFHALVKCIRLQLCPLSFLLTEVMTLFCACFDECHLLFEAIQWHQNPEMRSNLTYLNLKPRKLIEPNVLIVGGNSTCDAGLIEMYNPTLKTWSEFHDMGVQTTFSSYVILENKLFIFGGRTDNNKITNEVKCLNLLTKELTDLKPMQQKRSEAAAEIVDGRVFVMGGSDDEEKILNTVEQWNPITNTWTFMSPMKSKRFNHTTVVYKKEIYVFGGLGGSFLQTVEVYSPNTNTWRSICPMSVKRWSFVAVVLKDHIYVLGGFNGSTLNEVERFDPENNTWSRMSNLPEAMYGFSAVVINDRIICFGNCSTSSVLEYNPETDQWTKLGEIPNTRYFYKALLTHLIL